jgi:hypothetical protein
MSSRSDLKTSRAFYAALAAARVYFRCSTVVVTVQRTQLALIRVSFALRVVSE